MSTQASLDFDLPAGERDKADGMATAEAGYPWMDYAREIAREVVREKGAVTADDVQERLIHRGFPQMGNAAGSLFRGKAWECIGWAKSPRRSNHAHQNRVWRLKP